VNVQDATSWCLAERLATAARKNQNPNAWTAVQNTRKEESFMPTATAIRDEEQVSVSRIGDCDLNIKAKERSNDQYGEPGFSMIEPFCVGECG
jgi:hypothetical protein